MSIPGQVSEADQRGRRSSWPKVVRRGRHDQHCGRGRKEGRIGGPPTHEARMGCSECSLKRAGRRVVSRVSECCPATLGLGGQGSIITGTYWN